MTDDQAPEVAEAATVVAHLSQKRSLLISHSASRKTVKKRVTTPFLKLLRHPVSHQPSSQLTLKTVTLKSQRKK
jgi:hypothetical protein